MQSFLKRDVGKGGAEGLQPIQYLRIIVVKKGFSPINIRRYKQLSPTNICNGFSTLLFFEWHSHSHSLLKIWVALPLPLLNWKLSGTLLALLSNECALFLALLLPSFQTGNCKTLKDFLIGFKKKFFFVILTLVFLGHCSQIIHSIQLLLAIFLNS